jgi:TetR/AcrR family tetracycline transcriptional repressor
MEIISLSLISSSLYYLIIDKESSMHKKVGKEESRPSLDRSMVVQTALELLKQVGLDRLTTRRLADELGVKSPALYWHFRSKQELLDTMADALIRAAGMGPPRSGETWQEWLARRVRAYRTSLLAYPDSARIVARAQQLSPATIRAFNEELEAMVALGFDPVQALRTITALTNYVNGFILQEQSSPQPTTNRPVTRDSLAALLSKGHAAPLLVAFAEGGSPYNEASFEYGLQALIEGCAAALNLRASERTQ